MADQIPAQALRELLGAIAELLDIPRNLDEAQYPQFAETQRQRALLAATACTDRSISPGLDETTVLGMTEILRTHAAEPLAYTPKIQS